MLEVGPELEEDSEVEGGARVGCCLGLIKGLQRGMGTPARPARQKWARRARRDKEGLCTEMMSL